jgi:hypothetical protein
MLSFSLCEAEHFAQRIFLLIPEGLGVMVRLQSPWFMSVGLLPTALADLCPRGTSLKEDHEMRGNENGRSYSCMEKPEGMWRPLKMGDHLDKVCFQAVKNHFPFFVV